MFQNIKKYKEFLEICNGVHNNKNVQGWKTYTKENIEIMGYSLGGSLSNLLSHRTGLPSTALAPIGSKHIADKNKKIPKSV